MVIQEPLGRLVRRYRRAAELSQEALAERAGLSVRAIRDIEAGTKHRPRQDTVQLLLEALEVPAQERAAFLAAVNQLASAVPSAAGLQEARAPRASELLTILIADMRGYTRYTVEHGDEAAAGLAERFGVSTRAVAGREGGTVLELRGDEAVCVFSSARQALCAALALQEQYRQNKENGGLPLGVGIGIDAGEVVPVQGGYRGSALNLAARLCSLAKAGDILASEGVLHLAGKVDGIAWVDRGPVALKGLPDPVRALQVGREGELPATLPPLQPIPPTSPTNLPDQPTSFIGREQEIDQIALLLQEPQIRLVTLTGTGGVGKTRLALRVAADFVQQFPDGVRLAELASLADPSLVPRTVLAAIDIPEQPGRPPLDTLLDALRTRQLLLVLDNCEHLIEACARLADALLRACPRVHILATSREALAVAGESRWRVPSLSLPSSDQLASSEPVTQCEAVQLFVDRARAVQPSFVLTPVNAPAVARICTRLDGIPLALELAAARLSILSVSDLAARLDQRFRLLTGGSRTALPRQQTLRATVGWSYALLSPEEQTLFARLSIFAGGWSLEGAEAVGAGGSIAAEEVLDLLARLVDKSLVVAEESDDGATWYRQLETLRQYGWERLVASGEMTLAQRRHAAYYLAVAERADRELVGPNALRWFDLLEREHDNLRAALAWCLEQSDHAQGEDPVQAGEIGLRLAGSLRWFWLFRDHHREGLEWLDQALARGGAAPAAVRAQALFIAGILAGFMNALARSRELLSEDVALCRESGDRRQLSMALCLLGWATWQSEQDEQATAFQAEGLALARAEDEPWLVALALMLSIFRVANSPAIECAEERALAWEAGAEALRLYQAVGDGMNSAVTREHLARIALYEGDYERARTECVAALPMLRALGWRLVVAETLTNLADVAHAQGDDAQAVSRYMEALALYRRLGDQWLPAVSWVRTQLAGIALEQGEWGAAWTHLAESLASVSSDGQERFPAFARAPLASALEMAAALGAAQGAPQQAMRLGGAAAALRSRLNQPLMAREQNTLERRLAPARQALSIDGQAQAWAEGQAMTPEQAIAYALEESVATPLTAGERQPG